MEHDDCRATELEEGARAIMGAKHQQIDLAVRATEHRCAAA
jgi:hypothetical protein